MRIRSATTQDAARLLAIYTYYVEKTAISFECEVPSLAEFTGRIAKTLLKYPYLVMEEDGVVQGYTYAGPFKERAAYNRSCELSIYLDRDVKGRGVTHRNCTKNVSLFRNCPNSVKRPLCIPVSSRSSLIAHSKGVSFCMADPPAVASHIPGKKYLLLSRCISR